jgi:predicted transcriptional regulator
VALDITASIVSAYRLSTSEVKLSELNSDIPGLDMVLKDVNKLRKL